MYCSSLTGKIFDTHCRSHHIAGFGSGKTARAPTLIPFYKYNPIELAQQASKKRVATFALGAPPIENPGYAYYFAYRAFVE
jgi:hypothetical protein